MVNVAPNDINNNMSATPALGLGTSVRMYLRHRDKIRDAGHPTTTPPPRYERVIVLSDSLR